MIIFAIDPGTTESAWVNYQDGRIKASGKTPNEELLAWMQASALLGTGEVTVVIEMVASYGMPVGAEVFETCVWIGRFLQASKAKVERVPRGEIKLHLCGNTRAKDSNIRQVLIDRFGPGRELAIGTKDKPGPLYGVSGDVWAALAVAVTYSDKRKRGN